VNAIGHAGITLGVIFAAEQTVELLRRRSLAAARKREAAIPSGIHAVHAQAPLKEAPHRSPLTWAHYAALLIGAMLPDLIDKPLGFWLAPELVNNSLRSIGHTLVFNLALLLGAVLAAVATRRTWPLFIAIGSLGHLYLDRMWLLPSTILWPLLGTEFLDSEQTFTGWLFFHLVALWRSPVELFAGLVLLAFAVKVMVARMRQPQG
jgi:hypothetical protein